MEARNPRYREKVEGGFGLAAFVRTNGIELVECGPGWCEGAVELTPNHLQHTGLAHGGLIATLADHVAGGAAATLIGADEHVLTAEFKLSFLRAARVRRLVCRAEVIKAGSQLVFVEATVTGDAATGKALARGTVTMAVVPASR